jgi:hypothetical protein
VSPRDGSAALEDQREGCVGYVGRFFGFCGGVRVRGRGWVRGGGGGAVVVLGVVVVVVVLGVTVSAEVGEEAY